MEEGHFGAFRNEGAPAGKKRWDNQNLCLQKERQLLRDIEHYGGLHGSSVRAICNRKPDYYGAPNSTLRKAVQNKVTRWKKLSPAAYQLLVLDAFGCTGALVRNKSSDALHSPPSTNSLQLAHSPLSRQADELVSYESRWLFDVQ